LSEVGKDVREVEGTRQAQHDAPHALLHERGNLKQAQAKGVELRSSERRRNVGELAAQRIEEAVSSTRRHNRLFMSEIGLQLYRAYVFGFNSPSGFSAAFPFQHARRQGREDAPTSI
jgi:hypothetical protein